MFRETKSEFLEELSEFVRKPEFYDDLSFASNVRKKSLLKCIGSQQSVPIIGDKFVEPATQDFVQLDLC